MNYWLISDTHFNHLKLEEWGGRSGDWQKKLWDGLNSIPNGDVLFHLGDVSIGDDIAVNRRIGLLSCHKILVRGNHDKKSVEWYLDKGWDFVCDGFDMEYMGHYIKFTHRPIEPDKDKTTINIHGHTHGNLHRSEEYIHYYIPDFHVDISPELVGYKPLRLDTLLKNK